MTALKKTDFNTSTMLKDAFFGFSFALPLSLAVGVCSPLGLMSAVPTAIVCALFYALFGFKPSYAAFAVVCSTASYSVFAAQLGAVMCFVAVLIAAFFKPEKLKIKLYPPIAGAVMLGFALCVTIMQTTNYFGIGATGNNVIEMLSSYRSLGFHGNWRGVLYGTIVLVVMITYPRKFKKLRHNIPAAFWALLITTLLNLRLNPSTQITAINEIGDYSINAQVFLDSTVIGSFKPDLYIIIHAVFCAAALFIIIMGSSLACEQAPSRAQLVTLGIAGIAGAAAGAMPFYSDYREKKPALQALASGFLSCAACCAVMIFANGFIARIPVHSLAVVLILGMWQDIKPKYLKSAFTSGPLAIAAFIGCIILMLVLNTENAVLVAVSLSVILMGTSKKSAS